MTRDDEHAQPPVRPWDQALDRARETLGTRGLIAVGLMLVAAIALAALALGNRGPGTNGAPAAAVARGSGGPFLGTRHGCASDFWAQPENTRHWEEHTPEQLVGTIFRQAGDYTSLSLREALEGATPNDDVRRILVREAVTAVLNASHDSMEYPFARYSPGVEGRPALVPTTNRLLSTSDGEQEIRQFTSELATANTMGCPLG